MANQLLITKKGSGVLSVKVEDGKIAQIQAQPENEGVTFRKYLCRES